MDLPKPRGIREQRPAQSQPVHVHLSAMYSLEGCVFPLVARLSEARRVSPQYGSSVTGREGETNVLR